MSNQNIQLPEVLPTKGALFLEHSSTAVLCKPRIMPLKSVTLQKMDQIQKEAQKTAKEQLNSTENQSY